MRIALFSVLLTFALAGCTPGPTLPTNADINVTRGAAIFSKNCAACRGADGTGVAGPNLTTISAQNGSTFPRIYVMSTIDGLSRHGTSDAVMPEFGASGMGQTVVVDYGGNGTPVPADLLALTNYLEALHG